MKGLLLLSAGLDSPVAGYLMQKAGVTLEAIHFHSYPVSDLKTLEKSKKICKILGIKKIYVVAFAELQSEVVRKCGHRYYYIITRRLMYKIAELCGKHSCLITGENLGQVASQTLENMTIISNYIKKPIHRPLLTFDKNQIIEIAKKIDTYEISKGPEICCMLGPKNPVTKGRLKDVEREEIKLEIQSLIKDCLSQIDIIRT